MSAASISKSARRVKRTGHVDLRLERAGWGVTTTTLHESPDDHKKVTGTKHTLVQSGGK